MKQTKLLEQAQRLVMGWILGEILKKDLITESILRNRVLSATSKMEILEGFG